MICVSSSFFFLSPAIISPDMVEKITLVVSSNEWRILTSCFSKENGADTGDL